MSIPPQGQLHEHLLAEGLVTADQLEGALHRVRGDGSRIEDVLIESGVISEADLLKSLAKLYRTRFVATNKLARAEGFLTKVVGGNCRACEYGCSDEARVFAAYVLGRNKKAKAPSIFP